MQGLYMGMDYSQTIKHELEHEEGGEFQCGLANSV